MKIIFDGSEVKEMATKELARRASTLCPEGCVCKVDVSPYYGDATVTFITLEEQAALSAARAAERAAAARAAACHCGNEPCTCAMPDMPDAPVEEQL